MSEIIYEPVSKGGATREQLLQIGAALADPLLWRRTILNAPDEVMQRSLIATWNWGRYGFQSVELPQTFAAALMATDGKGALAGQPLPWPAFEIQIPPGLLISSHSELWSVIVSEVPKEVELRGMIAAAKYFVTYHDQSSTAGKTFASLEELFGNHSLPGKGTYVSEGLAELYDEDIENRVWSMISRLVAGVILTINIARVDKPAAYPQMPKRIKRNRPKLNTHRVGRPMTIDCRQSIRDFVKGTSGRDAPKSVSTLVRGHWRNQAYGANWKLHRTKWIEPFFRGDGPLTTRAIKIKPPTEEP